MNGWKDNIHWLKREKCKNIYFMRDHNYAFAAWEIGKLKGRLNRNATLFHVDAHIDDLVDGNTIEGVLDSIKTKERAIELAKGHDYANGTSPMKQMMEIANFIWPSVLRNTIGNRYYISFDSQCHHTNENLKEFGHIEHFQNVTENNKGIFRYKFVEEFAKDKAQILSKENDNSLILDIDLDYFNMGNSVITKLMEKSRIKHNLIFLRDLFNWDLITVALSPSFCGGDRECQYLLEIFMEVFHIKYEDLTDW